jgi:hypothetical protein
MWFNAVLFDIQANELRRFGPEVYHSETPSFTENGQRFFLWIKEVELESSHFAGSGAGVEKQIEYGIISEALYRAEIDSFEDCQNLFLIKKADYIPVIALLGNIQYPYGNISFVRILIENHLGQRFDGRQSVISRSGTIPPLFLEPTKKFYNQLRGELLNLQRVDGDTKCVPGKGQKEGKSIAVTLDRIGPAPFDPREILPKELVNAQ